MSLYRCYVCGVGTYKVSTDPDYKICEQCLPSIHYITKMASALAIYKYRDILYKMPCRGKSGRCIRIIVKYYTTNLTNVINLITDEIARIIEILQKDIYYVQPYDGPVQNYWDATDYYVEGYYIYEYYLPIRICKYLNTPTLAQLATVKCAELAYLEGLTDDAIDQIFAYDILLAIRYLY
ncbi:hypothetical protein F-S17_0221 [Faustovirus]|nr:hypothetical protein F-S17_0221 [Faustovirus]